MPASEPSSATYQRGHWPRTYAALVSCGNLRSEVLAKISDLYYNYAGDLTAGERRYITHTAVLWTNVVAEALQQHRRLSHECLTRGLKIIGVLDNFYARIEWRMYERIVKRINHGRDCVCSLCYVEDDSESEEL